MKVVQWKNDTSLVVLDEEDVWEEEGFSDGDLIDFRAVIDMINALRHDIASGVIWGEGYIVKGGPLDVFNSIKENKLKGKDIFSNKQEGLFVTEVENFGEVMHILPAEGDKWLLTHYQEGIESWSIKGRPGTVSGKIYVQYIADCAIPVIGKNIPKLANPGDAGVDLKAENECTVYPKGWQGEKGAEQGLSDFELQAKSNNVTIVHTGLHMAIPTGYMGLVVPRSGISLKNGIQVMNTPGILDSGYRGEIMIGLVNHGNEVFHINKGDRVAQLIIVPFKAPVFLSVDTLGETERGDGGFGSTGIK